jgi:phage repressor protein C with HTH and peptisase S24 domain
VTEPPRRTHRDSEPISEIDVKAGAGGGGEALVQWQPGKAGQSDVADAVAAQWEVPGEYLRTELRVEPSSTRILAVRGDSMEPLLQSGDRIMVNLLDRSPSPPGIYALWDGLGVVVKRLEHVMGTEPPRLRISSDNDRHQSYERTVDEVHIIGRVVWFGRRL